MSDKYEQAAECLQKISDGLFPLDGEITMATTKEEASEWYEANKKRETDAWAAYLRSQFPEPKPIEGVRELVENLVEEIRAKTRESGYVEYVLPDWKDAEKYAERLITGFTEKREAGKLEQAQDELRKAWEEVKQAQNKIAELITLPPAPKER